VSIERSPRGGLWRIAYAPAARLAVARPEADAGRTDFAAAAAQTFVAFIDIDAMQKRVYGYRKQGAAFGHTKIQEENLLVRGLNALAATISTPLGAPVIAATRLRGGNAASVRGAASMVTEAVTTTSRTGQAVTARTDGPWPTCHMKGSLRLGSSTCWGQSGHVRGALDGWC
jgi:hypothetical protein